MKNTMIPLVLMILVLSAGCAPDESGSPKLPFNPFNPPPKDPGGCGITASGFCVPAVITNTKPNPVQFWVNCKTMNLMVISVSNDLSSLTGPASNPLSNIAAMTIWMNSFLVASNTTASSYSIPVTLIDMAGCSETIYIPLEVR